MSIAPALDCSCAVGGGAFCIVFNVSFGETEKGVSLSIAGVWGRNSPTSQNRRAGLGRGGTTMSCLLSAPLRGG